MALFMAAEPREGKIAGRTIVLQSMGPRPWPVWLEACLDSVRHWARRRGYRYRFIGDSLFEGLSPRFMALTREEKLPRTDLGRLLWIGRLHAEGWGRVIWLDADVLVIDQSLDLEADTVGREVWLTGGPAGLRAWKGVNNTVLSFARGAPVFDRCLAATEAEAAAVSEPPRRMALGPDLFRRLHQAAPLPLSNQVAMLSPLLAEAVARHDSGPLAAHHALWRAPVRALNLCASLDSAATAAAAHRLFRDPALLAPPGPPPAVELVGEGPSPW